MRNLKRALCFALAAVMVLGLMITGAGAASTYDNFTDKDEIVHQEAVNTMVSLGVIAGKEDGSYFDPTAIVTRAEMTKVVAVALNGGKDPVFSDNDKTTFSDTQGHWAEKYIAYCVRQGIVAGRGDNSFGPDDPLTGSACAKMFLCALGYRADLEGFVNVGNDWELNVNVKANQDAKLYDELSDIKASDELTRDSMAQMLYNAVQANEVIYDNLYGDYSGVIQAVANGTMLANRFGVGKVEGVVVANHIMDLDNNGTTVSGKVRLSDIQINGESINETTNGVTKVVSRTYPVELGNEYLGLRVVLYVKGLKDLSPNASSMTLMGEPIISDDNTVAETANRLKDESALRSFLSDNGLNMSGDVVAGAVKGAYVFTADNTQARLNLTRDLATTKDKKAGTELTFIDHDGDGQVDYLFKTIPTLAKVSVYNKGDEELTIAGKGSIKFSDIANPEDVEKDDIVLYYKMRDTYFLEVAETVSGKVESYNKGNETLSVDGTSYMVSTAGYNFAGTDLEAYVPAENMIGNTYTLYLDAHGNAVAYVLSEESLGNYALILGSESSGSVMKSGKVKLLLADGTTAIYDVNLLSSANRLGAPFNTGSTSDKENHLAAALDVTGGGWDHDSDGGTAALTLINRIVTYSVSDKGVVTLTDPSTITNGIYEKAVDGEDSLTGPTHTADPVNRANAEYTFNGTPNVSVTVNDSTIFFIHDGSEYSVVHGLSNLPVSAMGSAYASPNDGQAVLKSALFTSTNANRNIAKAVWISGYYGGTKNFIYISGNYTAAKPTGTGETIYTYPAVNESGEATTIEVKGYYAYDDVNSGNVTIASGNVYEYTMKDGYADLKLTANTINGVVSTWSRGNSIRVSNGQDRDDEGSFTVKTDAKIYDVSDTKNIGNTTLTMNMDLALALDSDGIIKVAFVEDSNTLFGKVTNNSGAALPINGNPSVADGADIYVANGYDVEITTASNVPYTVKYTNGTADKEDVAEVASGVASFEMPANANVVLTGGTPGGDDGEGVTITADVATYGGSGVKFYVDDVLVPSTDITTGRTGLSFKAESGKTLDIVNSAWTANDVVVIDDTEYTVAADKGISLGAIPATGLELGELFKITPAAAPSAAATNRTYTVPAAHYTDGSDVTMTYTVGKGGTVSGHDQFTIAVTGSSATVAMGTLSTGIEAVDGSTTKAIVPQTVDSGTIEVTISGVDAATSVSFTLAAIYKMNSVAAFVDAPETHGFTTISAAPDKTWALATDAVKYTVTLEGTSAADGTNDTITLDVTGLTGAASLAAKSGVTPANCSATGLAIKITANDTATSGTFEVLGSAVTADVTPTLTYAAQP